MQDGYRMQHAACDHPAIGEFNPCRPCPRLIMRQERGFREVHRRLKVRIRVRMIAPAARWRRKQRRLWFRLGRHVVFALCLRAGEIDSVTGPVSVPDLARKAMPRCS